ncbi:MAG: response regulator transcription factor [Rectinemataceae bacterium]|jgi:DNA-binding response OmpR family regulator
MFDKTRVLVVEDDAGIRMTLEDMLVAEGCVVETRSDGPSGEKAARSGGFDIVLLDLMLPGRDGLAICRDLRDAGIKTPVIMLTALGADLDVIKGLRTGADDYVPKPFDAGVLIARMEALLRRVAEAPNRQSEAASSAGPSLVRFGEFILDRRKGELLLREKPVSLNAQEYRLLEFLAANPDRVIGRKEILDVVWGYDSETTTRTIDVHVAKLRARLGESELPRHILTTRGRGYKFVLGNGP